MPPSELLPFATTIAPVADCNQTRLRAELDGVLPKVVSEWPKDVMTQLVKLPFLNAVM